MTRLKIFLIICTIICVNLLFSIGNKKETTEITFWTVQLSPFEPYIKGVISDFEMLHPTIKVKWVDVPYSEAEKRVLASLLSNSMPDLINITADFNLTLASKGALKEVRGTDNYNDELLNTLSMGDKLWGIPFYATSAITVYNKDLMKEFKIKEPAKNYQELFSQIETAPSVSNKYVFMPTLTENDTIYKMINKIGVNSPETLTSDRSIKFFETIKKFYKENKIPKEAITQTHREVLEKYSAGQILYLQAGANFLNIINENSPDVYKITDIAPQFWGNSEKYDFSLMSLAIPLKSKNPKEAAMFAKFITNEENQLAFAKLTGVLPCNAGALRNEYFSKYEEKDLTSKARYLGAKQLRNPIFYPPQSPSHKEVLTVLNNSVQEMFLQSASVKKVLENAKAKWSVLVAD